MWKARLEVVSNIVVIVAVVILGGLTLRNRLYVHQITDGPKLGSQLPAPNGYDWSRESATLLLAVRKECHFCEQSVPFYQRLAMRQRQLSAHILALVPADERAAQEYAASRKLTFDLVPNADFARFNIYATPTLILVDRSGRVSKRWIGKLTDGQEAEVFHALGEQQIN